MAVTPIPSLPEMQDELNAVVDNTADAADKILGAVEHIEEILEQSLLADKTIHDKLMLAVTEIYEASSFQDITGQRINKVLGGIKAISDKGSQVQAAADLSKSEDDELLNGPQLPGQGISQDDIDKMF